MELNKLNNMICAIDVTKETEMNSHKNSVTFVGYLGSLTLRVSMG